MKVVKINGEPYRAPPVEIEEAQEEVKPLITVWRAFLLALLFFLLA